MLKIVKGHFVNRAIIAVVTDNPKDWKVSLANGFLAKELVKAGGFAWCAATRCYIAAHTADTEAHADRAIAAINPALPARGNVVAANLTPEAMARRDEAKARREAALAALA